MDNDDFWLAFIAIGVICFLCLVCLDIGIAVGKDKLQKQAIEIEVAQYNPKNKNFEFVECKNR